MEHPEDTTTTKIKITMEKLKYFIDITD